MKVTRASAQVTADGPVGASNRCVMLAEGYVELLAPTHDTPSAQRLRAYMARYTGVHLVCFGTPDAEGECRRLAAHGFAPQLVEFERKVQGGMARFKAVRVPPETMPEGRIQFVQQLAPEHVWLPGFVNPPRLDEVFVAATDPVEAAGRWARFAGLIPAPEGDVIRLRATRGSIVISARAAPAPGITGYALRGASAPRVVQLPPSLGGILRLER